MSRAAFPLLLLTAAIASAPAAARPEAPRLLGLHVTNGSTAFLGDNALLATVSPNGDGFRDAAHVGFRLTEPARVTLAVVQTDTAVSDPEAATAHVIARVPARAFPKGTGELVWQPAAGTPPRTYVLQLTVRGRGGLRVYGVARPRGPVV
jgi:hypothetical protein